MKRTIITILIILAAGAGIAWMLNKNKQENEAKTAVVAETGAAVIVTATQVEKSPVDLSFSVNGNFSANQDLKLMAEASGRITSLLVREGARVRKGQVLAHIDAEYASLELQRVEDALQKLRTDYERYQSSFETGGVTQAQLDEIELALRNTENQRKAAQRRLEDAYVKAPISGVINSRSVEVGAFVAPGMELFEIVDISRLKLDVMANESQVIELKKGDKVSITTTLFPDKKFSGIVNFIAVKADASLNYPVEILVDNEETGSNLKAGMYATAHFSFPQKDPIIMIPRGSFIGSVGSQEVYVMGSDSTAVLRKVTPGRIIGDQVEIIDGLAVGETVITSGQINLNEGINVQIRTEG